MPEAAEGAPTTDHFDAINAIKDAGTDTQDRRKLDNGSTMFTKPTELMFGDAKIPATTELLQRTDGTDRLSISFTGDAHQPIDIEFNADGKITKVSQQNESGEFAELDEAQTKDLLSKLGLPAPVPTPLE